MARHASKCRTSCREGCRKEGEHRKRLLFRNFSQKKRFFLCDYSVTTFLKCIVTFFVTENLSRKFRVVYEPRMRFVDFPKARRENTRARESCVRATTTTTTTTTTRHLRSSPLVSSFSHASFETAHDSGTPAMAFMARACFSTTRNASSLDRTPYFPGPTPRS